MSVLKTLNFVVATKRSNDPSVLRRAKLLAQLRQQRSLAENPMFIAVTQRWRKGEDGDKRLVERQKRVKRWWYVDPIGNCYLTINYGSKRLELDKGKSAIAVGGKDNLVATIDAVIAAVEAGELDAAISATQKTGQKPKARAA
jgi:hypothetical protein